MVEDFLTPLRPSKQQLQLQQQQQNPNPDFIDEATRKIAFAYMNDVAYNRNPSEKRSD